MERAIGFLESALSSGYHALLGTWVLCSEGFVGSKAAKQESLSDTNIKIFKDFSRIKIQMRGAVLS